MLTAVAGILLSSSLSFGQNKMVSKGVSVSVAIDGLNCGATQGVIDALTSQSFSRSQFLKSLDRFYKAIEGAAETLSEFGEKQHFLNTVYERFFQGYSVDVADTHGIVYTPQEIVDFISRNTRTRVAI